MPLCGVGGRWEVSGGQQAADSQGRRFNESQLWLLTAAVCSAEETSSDEEDGDGPAAQAVIVGNAPGGLPPGGADGAAEPGEQVAAGDGAGEGDLAGWLLSS